MKVRVERQQDASRPEPLMLRPVETAKNDGQDGKDEPPSSNEQGSHYEYRGA